jgi:hypothetical protein
MNFKQNKLQLNLIKLIITLKIMKHLGTREVNK